MPAMCCVRLADLLRTSGFRTGLLFMGLFGLGSAILFGTIYIETASFLSRQSEDWLHREIAGRVHSSPAERIAHLNGRLSTDPGEHRPFALFDAEGGLLAGRFTRRPEPPAFDTPFTLRMATSSGRAITYRAMAHRLDRGQMLVVAQDVDEADDFSGLIVHALLIAAAVMAPLGLAGATVLGRSAAHRIDSMRLAMERIVAGDLSKRLPLTKGSNDLDRLARAVNVMLDELERMVGEVKGVCDNLAHDLRTPLGRLLAGLQRAQRRQVDEAGLRAVLDTTVDEIKHILGIFGALLRISEMEDGVRRAGFEQTDLARIAADAVEYQQPAAEARGIRLDFTAPDHFAIEGDPKLLFEAVTNLLDNAIKFAGERGRVELSILPGPTIRVADDGPGIAADERQAVLRRFQRGQASRNLPGNGLGLPLVAAIARLHGMGIEIDDARPGCVMTLRPASAH